MNKLSDWLDERFDSIVNIEVNTINARGGMTGRKMPPWPEALCEIADEYVVFLGKAGVDVRGIETATLRRETFAALRDRAAARLGARELGTSTSDEEQIILYRIRRHSELLDRAIEEYRKKDELEDYKDYIGSSGTPPAKLAHEAPPPALPPAMATQLRKIWELGTDTIELQTVFQLDGDIVNRIALQDMPEVRRELLTRLHRESVERSFSYWRMIFDVFAGIFGR